MPFRPPPSPTAPAPQQHDALETQETCTQYNILKIARSMFTWSGDVRIADFYERAMLNGIIGVSRMPSTDILVGKGGKGRGERGGGGPSGVTDWYEFGVYLVWCFVNGITGIGRMPSRAKGGRIPS